MKDKIKEPKLTREEGCVLEVLPNKEQIIQFQKHFDMIRLVCRPVNQSKCRCQCPKPRRRHKRKIDLQCTLKQKHSIDPHPGHYIEMMRHLVFAIHVRRPVGHRPGDLRRITNTKRQIDIRPSIFVSSRRGTGDRRARDAIISGCPFEQ